MNYIEIKEFKKIVMYNWSCPKCKHINDKVYLPKNGKTVICNICEEIFKLKG